MSETGTVRLPIAVKREIEDTSKELGIPQSQVVMLSLKELKKKMFYERIAEDFLRLRSDQKASSEYDEEVSAWDATLTDEPGAKP